MPVHPLLARLHRPTICFYSHILQHADIDGYDSSYGDSLSWWSGQAMRSGADSCCRMSLLLKIIDRV